MFVWPYLLIISRILVKYFESRCRACTCRLVRASNTCTCSGFLAGPSFQLPFFLESGGRTYTQLCATNITQCCHCVLLTVQEYVPLPPAEEGEAPSFQYSTVECALFAFHQLASSPYSLTYPFVVFLTFLHICIILHSDICLI